jgi:hypothetical protein
MLLATVIRMLPVFFIRVTGAQEPGPNLSSGCQTPQALHLKDLKDTQCQFTKTRSCDCCRSAMATAAAAAAAVAQMIPVAIPKHTINLSAHTAGAACRQGCPRSHCCPPPCDLNWLWAACDRARRVLMLQPRILHAAKTAQSRDLVSCIALVASAARQRLVRTCIGLHLGRHQQGCSTHVSAPSRQTQFQASQPCPNTHSHKRWG